MNISLVLSSSGRLNQHHQIISGSFGSLTHSWKEGHHLQSTLARAALLLLRGCAPLLTRQGRIVFTSGSNLCSTSAIAKGWCSPALPVSV